MPKSINLTRHNVEAVEAYPSGVRVVLKGGRIDIDIQLLAVLAKAWESRNFPSKLPDHFGAVNGKPDVRMA